MTSKEELALINKEVAKELLEFEQLNQLLKYKKQRMYKLYAEQDRLWKKIIQAIKHV